MYQHSATDVTIRLEPVAETPTGQSQLAYRLAGAFTVFSGILSLLSGPGAAIIGVVLDLILGIGLLQLRPGARRWMLVRAVAGAVIVPFLAAAQGGGAGIAVFVALVLWMYVASLLLLLTGRTALWRIATSSALYTIYVLVALLGIVVTIFQ